MKKFREHNEIIPKESDNVFWVQEFTEPKALEFNKAVLKFSQTENSNRPILVYIDSYGGYCDSLTSMIGVLDSLPNPIVTVCVGKAMSCGAIMLAHGDYRYVCSHSRVMIHEVSSGQYGKVLDLQNGVKEIERLNSQLMEMLAADCGIKGGLKTLRKKFLTNEQRELYLDATSAIKFGIADEIGVPIISKVTHFELQTKGK